MGPYLIKLDTHGVEIPILNGSAQTLKDTNVLVVEVYNFDFGPPAVPQSLFGICANIWLLLASDRLISSTFYTARSTGHFGSSI